jgi:hypothetical protein
MAALELVYPHRLLNQRRKIERWHRTHEKGSLPIIKGSLIDETHDEFSGLNYSRE